VRRERRRFWKSVTDQDKLAAYQTLYQVLVTLAQALAPFTPFVSEAIFRNLKAGRDGAPLSVHLCAYPLSDPAYLAPELLDEMARARRVVEAGHAAREAARLKVRQPLASATLAERPFTPEIEAILRDELNLKAVTYGGEGAPIKVALDTTLTPELRQEGLARELIRKIQELRREANFEVDDRIQLSYEGAGALAQALTAWSEYIQAETLAVSVTAKRAPDAYGKEVQIGGEAIWVGAKRAAS
jgi:isoleucyl-tRNA synthetase